MYLRSPSYRKAFPEGIKPGGIIGSWNNLVLRNVHDVDAPAIIELVSSVWSEYPDKTLNAPADMPELLAPAASYAKAHGRFWVVEAHGQIIGTVAMKPVSPRVVELQKLYVRREMRNKGLGSFLCKQVESEARDGGALAIELWSDVKLLAAHRRYERLGYLRSGEVRTLADYSRTVQYFYRKELRTGSMTANDIDLTARPLLAPATRTLHRPADLPYRSLAETVVAGE